MAQDYYSTLGINSRDASQEEIKKAYRKASQWRIILTELAVMNSKFKANKREAYQTLNVILETRQQDDDQFGTADPRGASIPKSIPGDFEFNWSGHGSPFGGMDDIFEQMIWRWFTFWKSSPKRKSSNQCRRRCYS